MNAAELEAIKIPTIADFYGPVFQRVYFGNDATKHTGQFRRLHSGKPLPTTDRDHPEDDGWYYPVKKVEILLGNRRAFENQMTQAAYQTLINQRKIIKRAKV